MRRFVLRAVLLLAASACAAALALSGAEAQSPSPATETAATPAPTPAATAAPAPATPSPSTQPQAAEPAQPLFTPWPWPFPWMDDEETAASPQEAGAPAGQAGPPSSPGRPARTRPAPIVQPGDAATAEGDAAHAELAAAVGSGAGAPAPAPLGDPDAPQATAQTPGSVTVSQTCETEVIEHGLAGDTGAIFQVAVRNEDCSWSSGQALIAFHIRGPPGVDVLSQSAGVSVNIEVFVKGQDVSMDVAYRSADGRYARALPRVHGPSSAAMQRGDNGIGAGQDATATSGDALSGSQRVAVTVIGDASHIRILAQNESSGTIASSGDATSGNEIDGNAGRTSTGADAQAGQVGDNVVSLDQNARARSGDALAGAQQIEVRVSGSLGELTVLAGNAAVDAVATSGDAVATNDAAGAAGPVAASDSGPAQAGQVGDNRVRLGQSAAAATGDAIAGAQVIDVRIGGSLGRLAVLAVNDASGAVAESGDALAANAAAAVAGPSATSPDGLAQAAQAGDNSVVIHQQADATSGRALAGAQFVNILVGGGIGQSVVLPANRADLVQATSGGAAAFNDAAGAMGPQASGTTASLVQQQGDNSLVLDQALGSTTGDAVAGGQVVGFVTGAIEPLAGLARDLGLAA